MNFSPLQPGFVRFVPATAAHHPFIIYLAAHKEHLIGIMDGRQYSVYKMLLTLALLTYDSKPKDE